MDTRIADLEGQVQALTEKVEMLSRHIDELEARFTDRWSELKKSIFLLSHGKLADPRAPYFNWLLQGSSAGILGDQIRSLLTVLNERLTGEEVDEYHREAINKILQERMKDKVAARELLYGSDPPQPADVIEAIKVTAFVSDRHEIRDFMLAVEKQMHHHYGKLCEFVLAETGR